MSKVSKNSTEQLRKNEMENGINADASQIIQPAQQLENFKIHEKRKKEILDDCKHTIAVLEAIFEVALLALVFYFIWAAFYRDVFSPSYLGRGKYILIGVYVAIVTVIMRLCDGFAYGKLKFIDVSVSQLISLLIADVIIYFQLCLVSNRMISPFPMILCLVVEILLAFICCFLYTKLYHSFYVPHNILMIYGNETALDMKFKLDERRDKYAVREIISADDDMATIKAAISRHDAVLLNDVKDEKRNTVLKYCHLVGIRTYVVPKISDIIMEGSWNVNLFDTPLKLVSPPHLSLPQRFAKRTLDIILCLIAMIPGAPIMLIIALAIKIEDGGPIFYRQKRVTKGGRVFEILKFRSMVVDAERGGYNMTMRANGHDPRITKVGSVIRALRIDELPQILNILKGDMSIVGPRPERVENVEEYAKMMPEWHLREAVKGGLTGYAQVFGRYNTSPLDKAKMDLMYIENYSFFLDIKLIFLTVRILFSKEATEGFDVAENREKAREQLVKELEAKDE